MIENRPTAPERVDPWHIPVSLEELEVFTVPFVSQDEEQQLLAQFGLEVGTRHRHGLVIGRFQPLHYGHIFLIKQALAITDTITIGIGSSNVRNVDNPWSVEQRHTQLDKALEREGLNDHVARVAYLHDFMNDDFWLSETLKKTGEIDVVVGNNDWVNGIFTRANYPVLTTPLYHRNQFEGRKIREHLRSTRSQS